MIGSKEASVLGPKLGLPGKSQMSTQERDTEVITNGFISCFISCNIWFQQICEEIHTRLDDMDSKFGDVKNDISQLWDAYNGI